MRWQDLAEKGLYVHTTHVRRKKDDVIQPRGGSTIVEIRIREDHSVVSVAVANCNDKDNYSRRRGREIAAGRALKSAAALGFLD